MYRSCTRLARLLAAALLALSFAVGAPALAAGGESGTTEASAHEAATGTQAETEAEAEKPEHLDRATAIKFAWHAFNLLLFVGVVVYLARRPLTDELRRREHDIRMELTDAARARDEARQRHDELGTRISRFEEELEEMLDDARVEAKREEERLIERAHTEAERVGQAAQRSIRDEVIRAQVALRQEAVDLAVALATRTLRDQVQPNDQRRLARQFLDSLQADGVNRHG